MAFGTSLVSRSGSGLKSRLGLMSGLNDPRYGICCGRVISYRNLQRPSTCLRVTCRALVYCRTGVEYQLTKGATTNVATASAATVASIWNLLKSLPKMSKLKLGLSLVPKMSKP